MHPAHQANSVEAQLLRAYPESTGEPTTGNPHLPAALDALELHLGRHERAGNVVRGGEQGIGGAMGYLQFVRRSAAGLIRSRGW